MNQRIGINVSKELKNLKRRAKAPVLSNGYTNSYSSNNSCFYDEDEDFDMNEYNDEDDCCYISDKMKCSTKTLCLVGAGVVVGLATVCLLRRTMR